jgi:hypothetical protein
LITPEAEKSENGVAVDDAPGRTYRLSLAPDVAAEVSESFFERFCSFQSLRDNISKIEEETTEMHTRTNLSKEASHEAERQAETWIETESGPECTRQKDEWVVVSCPRRRCLCLKRETRQHFASGLEGCRGRCAENLDSRDEDEWTLCCAEGEEEQSAPAGLEYDDATTTKEGGGHPIPQALYPQAAGLLFLSHRHSCL